MATEWYLNVEPRRYQREAVEWALQYDRAVCCLPTGTGKTLVGLLWLRRLFERGFISYALVVEPTRLLVNQISAYLNEYAGVKAVPIDGSIPPAERQGLWTSPVVVCTAQTAFNDLPYLRAQAAVLDECHHTVGQHALAKLIDAYGFRYRLGLSATVPEKRRVQIEAAIGRIRFWSWADPEIQPYVPNWIGEVYEAELSDQEEKVLSEIRKLRGGPSLNPGLLERYLTRDGSNALRETLSKSNKLAATFGDLLPSIPDRLHKLSVLREVLDSHDFQKAVVFVDRVSIARKIASQFSGLEPVMFVGKGSGDQKQALNDSRQRSTQLIVSTSAGEEGIDLPSADLLVIWGNAASDIRFIQRLGRIMRKTGEGLKFAVFVVTPESNDFDSFADGLLTAAECGAVRVDEAFGWDPEILWPKTTWWHISGLLHEHPTPLPILEAHLGVRGTLAEKVVSHAARRGRVFYLHDVAQMATDIVRYYLEWDTYRPQLAPIHEQMRSLSRKFQGKPDPIGLAQRLAHLLSVSDKRASDELKGLMTRRVNKFSVKAPSEPEEKQRSRRIYLLVDDAPKAGAMLPQQLSNVEVSDLLIASLVTPITRSKGGGISKSVVRGLEIWGTPVEDPSAFWGTEIKGKWEHDVLGYSVGFRSIVLDFYFIPASEDVFVATLRNMNRLLLYRDVFHLILNSCSSCGRLGSIPPRGTREPLCLSCWQVGSAADPPAALVEFGTPVT